MKIIYSKAKSKKAILSTAIRLFTKHKEQEWEQTPSHMSLLFFNRLILEARGSGVILNYIETFKKYNDIVAVYEPINEVQNQSNLFYNALSKYHGAKYDFLAIFWYSLFIIRRKLFKIELPDMQKWQRKHRFYCSELLGIILENHSDLTPNDQMIALKVNKDFKQL